MVGLNWLDWLDWLDRRGRSAPGDLAELDRPVDGGWPDPL